MKDKFFKFINLQGKYLTSLLIVLTFAIGQMWGAVTTEVYDASGASQDGALTKTGSSIAGTYDAGQGGGNIKNYSPANKGFKLRTQNTKVTLGETQYGYAVITANTGYVLKSIKIEGTSNSSGTIDLLGVYTDVNVSSAANLATDLATATNHLSSTVTYPNKDTNYESSPTLSIDASSNIVLLFPGSGNNQLRTIITIGYEGGSGDTKSSAKKLLSLKFNNGFDAFINESAHTVTAYYLSGTEAPSIASHTQSEKASYAISGNTITITAEDATTQDYTLTLSAVEPYEGTGEAESFDGTETYIKTGYTFDSSNSAWRFAKNADDGRIQLGSTRLYFFVDACQELKLTSCATSRNMKVYRNGTELAAPTASGGSGTTITIAGSDAPAIYGLVSNQTGGDAKFNAIQIVPISTTPVDPTFVYTAATYTIGDPALDLSTKLTSDSEGAITFAVSTSDAGTTGASIANGKNFTATDAGTATITVSQEAATGFNAKTQDITVTVQAAPEEKAGIKMIEAGALTGKFRIKADQLKSLSGTNKYTVDGIDYTKYILLSSSSTGFSAEEEGANTKNIFYTLNKENTRFWFYAHNGQSSNKKIYAHVYKEGSTSATSSNVSVSEGNHLVYIDVASDKNAEVHFSVEHTDVQICQIVAVETGDALPQGGEVGYVFDYSKKRLSVAKETARVVDGIEYYLSDKAKISSGANAQLTTLGTHYIKFHLDARTKVSIECDNKPYKIGTSKSGETAQIYNGQDDGAFNLAAGDWYINGAGETVKITKLSFLTPDAAYSVTYSKGTGSVKEGKSLPTQADAMAGEKITIASADSLEKSGYDFDGWLCNIDEEKYAVGAEYTMTAAATTFTAQWKLHEAKYGVKFMDGTTKLDSLSVTLGVAPSYANPTKALYTFAGWKDGEENDVTLSDLATTVTKEDSVVVLYAQWTKLYVPQGANYVFEDAATVGTAPNSITVKTDNTANAIAANSRIDNMWLSAMSVKQEGGTYSGSGDDFKGWKINTSGATIRFFVENNCRVTVTVGNLSSGLNITYTGKSATEEATTALAAKQANNYDVKGGTLVTLTTAGGNTVTLKGIAVGDIPALSDDSTLSGLEIDGVAVEGFTAEQAITYRTVPYGTAVADMPKITGATVHEEHATYAISPETAPEWNEQNKCYIQQVIVTAQNGTSKGYYHVRTLVEPKYGVCLIKGNITDNAIARDAASYLKADDVTLQNSGVSGHDGSAAGSKFQGNSFIKIELPEGKTFKTGDMVAVNVTKVTNDKLRVFKSSDNTSANIIGEGAANMKEGINYILLTEDARTLYMKRGSDASHYKDWNPHVNSVGVYRYMAPFIDSLKIGALAGAIDEEHKTIAIELPNGTSLTGLAATVQAYANGGATVVPSDVLAYDIPLVYTVKGAYAEDLTGDYAPVDYTLTITEAVAIKEVVISGTLTVKEDETTALSAVVYDTNDQEASIQDVTWSVKSGDEGLASVDANGVVTGKAAGTAHIIATSVADNTKSAEVAVVVSENPCRTWSNPTSKTEVRTLGKMKVTPTSIGTLQENMVPYQDATACNAWKLDSKDSRYAEINFTDNAQFQSLTLGVSSNGSNKNYKFAVVCSSKAGEHFSDGILSAASYDAVDNDEAEALVDVELATGTKAVRVYREVVVSSTTYGGGSSVFLYYINACKKEFVPVTAVAVADANLSIGNSLTLSATSTPANADIASFTWSIVPPMTATGVSLEGNVLTAAANATEGNVVVKVVAKDVLNNEVEATATIHVVNHFDAITPVTETTTWSWETLTVPSGDGPKIAANDTVLANYLSGAEWEKIAGKYNEYVWRRNDYKCYQGTKLNIVTTVPGVLTVKARRQDAGDKLYVNGDKIADLTTDQLNYSVAVPAGEVKITGTAGMRIYAMTFKTLDEVATPDYSRTVTIDRMGTVCVDHNVPAGCFIGAEVYKLLYWKYGTSYADCQMVDFEQVDEMEAGNPYLIIPTADELKLYYGAVVDETPNTVNHFIGTYNAIAQGEEGDAILMGKYGIVNNQIRLLGAGAYSPANRAFIDLENLPSKEEYEAAQTPNPAPKRRISLSRQGTAVATGLDAISVETEKVQKVMIDGQMYIIRNGHVFTVSGNLVK